MMIEATSLLWAATLAAPPAPIDFRDVADAAGIRLRNVSGSPEKSYIVESTGSGGCFLDYDGDGLLDLYVVNGSTFEGGDDARDALFRNLGGIRFADVTQEAGILHRGWGGGCAVGDVDNDGDPDLYVTNFGPNVFYVNQGDGTFLERTEAAGLEDDRVSSSAAFGDLDQDGFVDLVVGTYLRFDREEIPRLGDGKCFYRGVEVYCGPDGLPGDSNALFRNRGDGTFENRTREAGIFSTDAKTLGLVLSDLDGDGLTDIYAACDSTVNLVFRNLGAMRFEDHSLLSGAGYSGRGFEQSGMGVTAGDPDSDGDFDLFVTNFQNDANTFYVNRGGGEFEDVTDRLGLSGPSMNYLSWGAHFSDFDNDGDEDLFVANGHVYPQAEAIGESYLQRDQLFENQGGGSWVELGIAGAPRGSRGTAVGDFDGDGWLDVFVNHIDDTPSLLRSEGGRYRSLKLHLVGTNGNRQGLGARVELRTADSRQYRELRSSDGYLGSNDPRIHFGLKEAGEATAVRILWPGGRGVDLGSLAAGHVYVVKENFGVVALLPLGSSR